MMSVPERTIPRTHHYITASGQTNEAQFYLTMMPPQAWPSCQALWVSVGAFASGWFRIVAILDNAGQDDRVAVGKLGDQG
jgi:hypothetical protein